MMFSALQKLETERVSPCHVIEEDGVNVDNPTDTFNFLGGSHIKSDCG